MEQTFSALSSVWSAVVNWFAMIEDGTGIPLWTYIISFALLGILFRHLVFPLIGAVGSDTASKRKKGK